MHLMLSNGAICHGLPELWRSLLHSSLGNDVYINRSKILQMMLHISKVTYGKCGLKSKEDFGLGVKTLAMSDCQPLFIHFISL